MKSFFRLRPFLSEHKRYYIIGIGALILTNIAQLVIPKLLGYLTDLVGSGELTWNALMRVMIAFIILSILIAFFRYFWRINIMGTARRMEYTLRNMLFEHLQTLPPEFFNYQKTGDLMAHATNDIHAVRMALGPGIVSSVDAFFLTTVILIMMSRTISLSLTLVALLPLPIMLLVSFGFGRLIHRRFRRVQEAFSRLTEQAQENFAGIRVIKGFARERSEEERFRDVNEYNVVKNMDLVRVHALFHPLVGYLAGLSFIIVLGYGGILVLDGAITIGDFIAFNSYLGMLTWPVMAIGWVMNMIQRGKASMDRLNDIFHQRSDIVDPGQDGALAKLEGKIEFCDLSFSYPTASKPVLKGISAEIEPGQVVGILGRTGSGKTTLLNLLLRLYNVQPGMLKLDGVDIDQISLEVLRDSIGYVPQDSFLFSATIRENIDFASTGGDLGQVIEYAKIAQVYDNIVEFPQQFDTVVGERGVTLSGGQKQRIAIARALIKEPQILIMDDSLSAVDTETEEAILTNLRRVFPGKTVIIVSHRISTLKSADQILVLEEGQISQRGTHDELVQVDGLYKEMYQKQLLEERIESVS
ncbi:MAG TPA: ABC transporter ATP-binding protein [Firmicutes bacterium]|nr:ABC transporter ATP-binding protein [Bacillota bacterium]